MPDSKNLKMKFKLHQLEFEIEGDQEVVKEQFENFKSFVTGDLLPKINVEEPIKPSHSIDHNFTKQLNQAEDVELFDANEIPSLKDIKLRDLAKSETDWIMVYAFLASDGGNKTFTRTDIVQLYKDSDRYSNKIANGLSQYFKHVSKTGFIKATSDSDFIILEKGKEKASQIFQGKSHTKVAKSAKQSKTTDKGKTSKKEKASSTNKFEFSLDKKLDLRPEGKESLKQFADKYELDSTPKQIIVIIYYLKKHFRTRDGKW